jgi:hypothetical protein
MQSSKENTRKHKNDLDKRGKYQKFDNTCRQMRDLVIKFYSERVIAQAASSGGSYHWGFIKDLVNGAAQVAPS